MSICALMMYPAVDFPRNDMPLSVPLIGRELCFWCVEAFRECPIHENSRVFWNDVAVRSYSDESDGFAIVNEKELKNVERCALYTENGRFILPPNASSLPILSSFNFENYKEKPEVHIQKEVESMKKEEKPVKKGPNVFKKPKLPSEEKSKYFSYRQYGYGKPHKNAIKTTAREFKKGKKCDKSKKVFVCDICEFSFTLRHNLQSHIVQFHGETENVSDEKVALLKKAFPRKIQLDLNSI